VRCRRGPDRIAHRFEEGEHLLVTGADGDLALGAGAVAQPVAEDVRVDRQVGSRVLRRTGKSDLVAELLAVRQRAGDLIGGARR
jgi:hypothetical protein